MPQPSASGDLKSHSEPSAWIPPRTHTPSVAYTNFEVLRPPRSEDLADFRSRVNRPDDLELSNLLMRSRVIRVIGFLTTNFQLPMPFPSRLRVRHETDRQTDDGHQRFMPHPMGAGA